ncbi:T9SS type A sorting domain-containing protein [Flavobacterium sp. JAS]|uniref:T9SS type A sorting domain-containing protein n=1 Tax=Flavobacterium sp. JAS TaxID=2897329 RepID=UPI001E4E2E0E|nr:T9SS type A sorting domain-containing protein [Flavobacterium sp. JAS]MCD0469580.1 T9SS type A sorting domain-containing protein [Flavobacterium sp. JAS]
MKTKLLLLLLLANFSIYAQTNLVPNGSFETWSSSSQPNNWYRYFSGFVSQSTTAQNGASSTNMMVASGTFNYINSEYFPVTANKTYRVTLYHRAVKGTFSSVDLSLYHKPGTFKEEIIKKSDVTFSTTEWRKIEFEYTPTVTENVEVDIWTTGSLNSEILVDNVSMIDIADAPTQYTLIPDANFEKKLISLGIDSGTIDGKVSTNNINKVTSLNISNSSITDLTGIQDFAALTSLTMYFNKLTNVNISKNTALIKLDLSWNSLSTLDVSNNPSLYELNCGSNNLTTLDLSKNINLTRLECSQNKLSTLDLSNNTKLTVLSCVSNKFTTVDISKNLDLLAFECYQNQITTLDLSKNTKLNTLKCFSNKLTDLDVSNNIALRILETSYNDLTTLNVSQNVALNKLQSNGNLKLTSIDLRNGKNALLTTTDLFLGSNPSLNCILVDNAAYSNANWSANKDDSATFSETECAPAKYTLIPDPDFEKFLIQKGIDGPQDGKVFTKRIATVTTLNFSDYYYNLKITDLTGIQDFTALEVLKLPNSVNGTISTLDVSHNLKLKILDCYQNKLTTLDVSNNLALTELNVYRNNLTTLNISKNSELTKLDCSVNRLTSLDVTANKKLKSLACSASNVESDYSPRQGLLTSLDLSQNLELEVLNCSSNDKLVGLDVSKNIKLISINVSNNKLTSIDFSANKLLKNISCEANQITNLDLSKYPALETLQCSSNQLTTLDVSQKPALTFLICEYNQLTSLDVSKNPALERLYCSGNKIASLDLSANPNLKQLLCGSNNMSKLNLKNGSNTKFETEYQSIFSNNPNLLCILVDDVDYSNKAWAKYKDATASYNTECSFSLPSKNFTVASKGESCVGENNGEITITATAQFPYVASINGKPATFTNNSLKANNLAPGTYTVIITIPGEVYEQTFNLAIAKATTVSGNSNTTGKKVNVEITDGTAPFTVFLDGTQQFQTTDSNFSLNLNSGGLLEVATAKACEGIFSKKIATLDLLETLSAYPNPTSGSFEIEIPTSKNAVKIELYNFGGQLISNKAYIIENGKAQLNLENQASGIYAAKVYLETPEYLKIIKK